MEKIVIVGPPGAGKTTFAKDLGSAFNSKAFHLDRFFWQRDWKRVTEDNRIDTLQNLVREQRWIIEGTYINSSKLHLNAADTIVFLDPPILVCLLRIIKRHFMYHGRTHQNIRARRDLPEGCTDKLTLLLILKVLLFPLQGRIKLEKNLHKFPPEKVIQLHSAKEVEDFLANLELYTHKKRQSVKTCSVLE